MDLPFLVRAATPDDLPFLVDLRAAMFEAMGEDVSGEDWRAAAYGWFERALAAEGLVHVVVSCDDEDRPVACAVAQLRDECPSPGNPDGGSVLVHTVSALADHRGQGRGRACFDAVLAWARDCGLGRVELLATPDGEPMYAAAGFERTAAPFMRLALPLD